LNDAMKILLCPESRGLFGHAASGGS